MWGNVRRITWTNRASLPCLGGPRANAYCKPCRCARRARQPELRLRLLMMLYNTFSPPLQPGALKLRSSQSSLFKPFQAFSSLSRMPSVHRVPSQAEIQDLQVPGYWSFALERPACCWDHANQPVGLSASDVASWHVEAPSGTPWTMQQRLTCSTRPCRELRRPALCSGPFWTTLV